MKQLNKYAQDLNQKTLGRASLKALGLSDGATQVEIREAYLQLTKVFLVDT